METVDKPQQTIENEDVKNNLPINAEKRNSQKRSWLIGAVIVFVVLLILVVLAVSYLVRNPEQTRNIRDIFIILMALESIFVGLVLALLVIQLAQLINLLQNEIKPILDSTNDTANTLRGTAVFLSDQLTEPIIQLNGYLAALQKVVELFHLKRK